jgi:hypothetical protein
MRLTGWEQRLAAYTRSHMRTPYRWGSHDCALFAAGAVEVITGEDFAHEFRGNYDDEPSAARVLSLIGCADVADLASRYLHEISPSEARRGDVVMIEGKLGPFLAIVDGRTAVGPAARGLTHSPVALAQRAWGVG